MLDITTSSSFGKRYRLLNQLGSGGMGTVYRSLDRLTSQHVALKRVTMPTDRLLLNTLEESTDYPDKTILLDSTYNSTDLRLNLAQEFRLLASLRHPNIISVLDYGFDESGSPYYTMELLENAQTIVESGQGKPLIAQVGLLVDVLRSLAYLHRRGIIHRDLKPANVLVVNDQVKVLDFGLSEMRDADRNTSDTAIGTLSYMAPEIINGKPISEATDLYALGIIAYQLFAGRLPFEFSNISALVNHILTVSPDLTSAGIDRRLIPVLMRLIAKTPEDRFADAAQTIAAFSTAIDHPFAVENVAIRESFIQAARLVGRDAELAQLSDVLSRAIKGQGSAFLLGGESGVGKSRLLEELRITGLAQGAVVVRGQGIREGSSLYQLWRPILRWMSLLTDLTTEEASILKPLVPDIATLLGHDVPDSVALEPDADQIRLLGVIEDIFRRQKQPMLLILEDLQWASSENLAVLSRLNRIVNELPLFIVGSYTTDERADLPAMLADMHVFKLQRLKHKEIAELSAAMLGKAGRQEQIIDLLQRETEGNVFFLVEVVRTLAERAGQLDKIGELTLPTSILTGKVQDVVKHRLSRIPSGAHELLKLAAVLGRYLDIDVLRQLDPAVDVNRWLATCSDIAILDVQDGNWRFAHDKLREGLLVELSETERANLHRQCATAIEAVYPNPAEHIAALAFHWRKAGQTEKELHYSILAGGQALRSGAYLEAIDFLSRALSLSQKDNPVSQRAHLTRQLADAHYGIGNLTHSRDYLYQVLELLNNQLPTTNIGRIAGVVSELLKQSLRRFVPLIRRSEPAETRLVEAARACERLAQVHYLEHNKLAGLVTILRLLNLGETIGHSSELARAYASVTLAAGVLGLIPIAERYSRRAQDTANQVGQPLDIAYVAEVTGIYYVGTCQWEKAQQNCKLAVETYERFGNWRWWEESLLVLAIAAYRQADFMQSSKLFDEVYRSANRRGGVESQIWGLTGRLWSYLPLGVVDETSELLAALPIEHVSVADKICLYTAQAQVALYKNNRGRARELAGHASQLALHTSPTAQYSFPGYSGLAQVYLALWESSEGEPPAEREALRKLARQACQSISGFARAVPAGKPAASLWQGLYNWLDGKPTQAYALWHTSLSFAKQLSMPYEEGLAHHEIGRHLPIGDPAKAQHLAQAVEIFKRIGAVADLERVNSVLSSIPT